MNQQYTKYIQSMPLIPQDTKIIETTCKELFDKIPDLLSEEDEPKVTETHNRGLKLKLKHSKPQTRTGDDPQTQTGETVKPDKTNPPVVKETKDQIK